MISGPNGQEITQPVISGDLIYEGPNVMLGYADTRADLALGQKHAGPDRAALFLDALGLLYLKGRCSLGDVFVVGQ